MQLLGVQKWYSANTYSNTKQKHVCWIFVKSERMLAVLREHLVFSVKWVEAHKMSDVFERTILWNKSSFSPVFVLALRLFARISEMSTGTCGWICKCCMPEIIFSKRKIQVWDFESSIFWPKFHFWGTALGRFSQCCFFHFSSLANPCGR